MELGFAVIMYTHPVNICSFLYTIEATYQSYVLLMTHKPETEVCCGWTVQRDASM